MPGLIYFKKLNSIPVHLSEHWALRVCLPKMSIQK